MRRGVRRKRNSKGNRKKIEKRKSRRRVATFHKNSAREPERATRCLQDPEVAPTHSNVTMNLSEIKSFPKGFPAGGGGSGVEGG